MFQIRALWHPEQYPFPDTLRVPSKLRDPAFQAYAAYEISEHGTVWDKWSTYRSGRYQQYAGTDFTLREGHPDASKWPPAP